MNPSLLLAVAFSTASLLAQQPAAPSTPAKPTAATVEAGSPAATALVDKAIAKMKAYGRGEFATTQVDDPAMLRGANLPFGRDDIEVGGGWSRGTVWGEHDDSQFVRANGRMVVKFDDDWRLRGSKLANGKPAPFTLDPELLFTVLGSLPEAARKVVHVDTAEVGGKAATVLSLAIEQDAAHEFAESGAIPGGGASGLMMLGGPPGMGTESDYTVYVALFVDPDSGDLLRFASKAFEKNEMMGHVQIQVAGGLGGGADEEDEDDEKSDGKDDGALVWKQGLPTKKPAKDESVMTFRVDFKKLGLAAAPQLGDKAKVLLRIE